jgi:D-proline reductase (dithiol) PrdB
MHNNDQVMKDFAANLPAPEFENPAFTRPPALRDARVAIVTSAALSRTGGVSNWKPDDAHFETIPAEARDLELGHLSPNFDRAAFHADLNCVYPIDRLNELAEQGVIGSVASFHYAFAGNQPDSLSGIRLDSGPACARQMLEDGVDVVLLTPV